VSDEAQEPEEDLVPRKGCWFFVLPILAAVAVVLAYVVILALGIIGRPAEGPRVRMAFTGCDEAQAIVRERAEAMGLGDPVLEDTPAGFALTATMPADPPAAREIPDTLAATGHFEIHAGQTPDGERLADGTGVSAAVLRLDFTATPRTGVELKPEATQRIQAFADAHPDDPISFWLDGVKVGDRKVDPKEALDRLDLVPNTGHRDESIRRAAAWSMELEHGPLPCALTVQSEPAPK